MTTYRIWPSTNGDPVLQADSSAYSLSVEFTVTQAGCMLTGYYWWVVSGGAVTTKTHTLWSCTTGTTGTQVTAATATSGTQTANAWNFTACTPTALTANQHYRAEVTYAGGANWYSATTSYFSTGGGASNIVTGPLTCFSAANALGTVQGGSLGGSTPTYATNSSSANFWVDVQVYDGVRAGKSRLVPQAVRRASLW